MKAKQPSKRQREMAARYCDAAAAFFAADMVTNDVANSIEPYPLLAVEAVIAVDDANGEMMLPAWRAWAEAAAWLRSGEDLP